MFDIKKYEAMTKLDLPEAERAEISERAEKLMASFGALEAINTADVQPMFTVLDVQSVLREDVAVKFMPREELMQTAPEQYDGYFEVPKTVE